MDMLIFLVMIGLAGYFVKAAEQRQRIGMLGACLQQFQLEKLMETLSVGYLRALDTPHAQSTDPAWQRLENTEQSLGEQLGRAARELAGWNEADARISQWAQALPLATRLLPKTTFDLRAAMRLHADGFAHVLANAEQLDRKAQAHRLLAELLLFQHTCHWYCRSRSVASMRLLLRHQTTHEQAVASVSERTRVAYAALTSA